MNTGLKRYLYCNENPNYVNTVNGYVNDANVKSSYVNDQH